MNQRNTVAETRTILMNRGQRVVLILSSLLLTYCLIWIPWSIHSATMQRRLGYGWLWAGPTWRGDIFDQSVPPPPAGFTIEAEPGIPDPDPRHVARPDLELIALRFLAAIVISGAAFLIAGLSKK
jgi:hypothetical protein